LSSGQTSVRCQKQIKEAGPTQKQNLQPRSVNELNFCKENCADDVALNNFLRKESNQMKLRSTPFPLMVVLSEPSFLLTAQRS